MDAEFWASRVTAARRQAALQPDQYFCLDDLDSGEPRVDFLCPYCYSEYDIVSLCAHLEEEHSYESAYAACPICSVNVGSDIVGHITSQHSHLLKISFNQSHVQRKKKYLKGRTNNSSLGGSKERFQSLFGVSSLRLGGSSVNDAPDPLLSSFISGLPIVDSPDTANESSLPIEKSIESSFDDNAALSADESVPNEEMKEKTEEGVRRAEFAQQLVLSVFMPSDF